MTLVEGFQRKNLRAASKRRLPLGIQAGNPGKGPAIGRAATYQALHGETGLANMAWAFAKAKRSVEKLLPVLTREAL